MKGCYVCKKGGRLPYVFGSGRMDIINEQVEMCKAIINEENITENKSFLKDIEVMFCTWDMLELTKEEIAEYFPNLEMIFYAAASVQYFARPFLSSGVRILSARNAMAIPVAEFTVALITLANKGALLTLDCYKKNGHHEANQLVSREYPGSYKTKVGILGAGAIGSLVIKMLKNYNMEIMVYDPFLSDANAKKLGVEKYTLEEIFTECQTISNHLANNEKTVGMLNYRLFSLMKDNAAFINTGRGAQVVEVDLVRTLKEKPKISALLDVTYPEPVDKNHEFLNMENVFLFPHIAGFAADEVLMFSDCMIEQLNNYLENKPLEHEVTIDMLDTMA